tara:strand:- start:17431 stop:17772 length:342 start_codon:yes stop_codon:yes gene_type:complete
VAAAFAACLVSSAISIPAYATGFTSAQVLNWPQKDQDSYFLASITMAGVVAAQNPGGKARCVNDWYLKDTDTMNQRNTYIRNTLRRFPDHHPAGVMIAILEEACGSFTFSQAD